MCATLADAVRCSARQDTFDLRDMHKQKSMPFATDAVEKEIHVVDQDGQTYRGAQAILKIASQYPRLRMLATVGRLPVVRPLLPVGYNIVARNRRFLFGAASRVFWLKAMIALVFCVGLVMSSRLWIGPRTYPLAPALSFLPSSIHPADLVFMRRSLPLQARSWFRQDRRSSSSGFWASSSSSVSWIRPAGSRGSINTAFCSLRWHCSPGIATT